MAFVIIGAWMALLWLLVRLPWNEPFDRSEPAIVVVTGKKSSSSSSPPLLLIDPVDDLSEIDETDFGAVVRVPAPIVDANDDSLLLPLLLLLLLFGVVPFKQLFSLVGSLPV